MKTELLTTFLEVSRTLHIRIAAENLFITQAAVSSRIKQLENELGVLLFDRSNKRLKLTPEGHKLVKYANEFLAMWQKIKHDVGLGEEESAQLFVGAVTSIWDMVLHDWLQKIHRNFDDLHLYTHSYSQVELRKQVLGRLVDIGFVFEPPHSEEISSRKVATVPLQLVSSRPVESINEIDNFVMVDYGESVNAQFANELADELLPRHHMNQPRIALNFILEANGAAYLPKQMSFSHLRKNQLHLVPNSPTYQRDIYAIYLTKGHKATLIEDTLELFPYVNR
ncbi:LysR family transcriptional regulator [Vibrio sp. SCSIO 43136]|uniref:LysR family transcriptional regulator n=1 Tax=Vibrio sp. SCSIO 43136 TaxID=2819101 RepID=UPI00218622F0|nr:LysR family transcriptional regulator [Vibrio sp. SCSIO 43136]USD68032.1 LysR family transcriptional regulator [Vibrio sp. SCSIO 43136]